MSVLQDTKSETPNPQSVSDRRCPFPSGSGRCPAATLVVMHVLDGEVHMCSHHARSIWPTPYPAFWKDAADVVFDTDHFWEAPVVKAEEPEVPVYEHDDEDDDEDDEEYDDDEEGDEDD